MSASGPSPSTEGAAKICKEHEIHHGSQNKPYIMMINKPSYSQAKTISVNKTY